MPNFAAISQTSADIWRFIIFFKLAAIRHLGFTVHVFVVTTHEEHLLVFIVVQNLVGINLVVSMIHKL